MAIGLYQVNFLVLNSESGSFTIQALVWLGNHSSPTQEQSLLT